MPTLLADGSNGQLYVVSTLTSNILQRQVSRVVELDLNGTHQATFDLAQLAYPAAAVTDPQGTLIVVGQDASYQGIAVKLDPPLQNAAVVVSLPATIHAVTADGDECRQACAKRWPQQGGPGLQRSWRYQTFEISLPAPR